MSEVDRVALERDVLATLMPGFPGFEVPEWIEHEFARGMQSVCVYGSNIRSRPQLEALGLTLRAAAPHALIAIDEEGGEVTRLNYLEGSPHPGAAVLGRIDDIAYTEAIGRRVGREVLASGFDLVLGPVADVNSNPLNPVIGTRSFGASPELASRHVAAWVRGLTEAGAIACPKHFPGHGDTAQDSHLALPVVDAAHTLLSSRDLPPFSAAFAAGAETVMTSHILLPEIDADAPATFSSAVLDGLLRGELGFTGVIVSDALDMAGASGEIGIPEAAVRALAAGCDLLCIGVDISHEEFSRITEHLTDAVVSGRLAAGRVRDAARRVRELAERSSARTGALAAEAPATARARDAITTHEVARIAESFSGAEEARRWCATHPDAAIVRIDTLANMAVGFAPWGPFAAAAAPLASGASAAQRFRARAEIAVDEHSDLIWPVDELVRDGVIVVGREIHRTPFARETVDALRSGGVPVLVVEMGWPEASGEYADLATYGSTALVGSALLALIEDTHL